MLCFSSLNSQNRPKKIVAKATTGPHLFCSTRALPGEECLESMWVRMKVWAGMADIIVEMYYRSPDQEDEVTEAF